MCVCVFVQCAWRCNSMLIWNRYKWMALENQQKNYNLIRSKFAFNWNFIGFVCWMLMLRLSEQHLIEFNFHRVLAMNFKINSKMLLCAAYPIQFAHIKKEHFNILILSSWCALFKYHETFHDAETWCVFFYLSVFLCVEIYVFFFYCDSLGAVLMSLIWLLCYFNWKWHYRC